MKFKLLLMVFAFCLASTVASAAFPVKRVVKTTTNTTVNVDVNEEEEETFVAVGARAGKDKVVALLLWFFLGGFAAHRWYLGSPVGWNILYIVTFGGLLVWAIIDLIDIITGNYPGL